MGLFDKVKKQLSTGGIDVHVDVPASISVEDPYMQMQLTLTSGDEPQQMANVYVELILERTELRRDFNDEHQHGPQRRRYPLARVDMGPTSIDAGQQRRFTVTLPLDALRNGPNSRDVEIGDSPFADAAETLIRMGADHGHQDSYLIRATVELDGMRDPSDTKLINIVGAGNQTQFGFRIDR